jgi:hypothetical protein
MCVCIYISVWLCYVYAFYDRVLFEGFATNIILIVWEATHKHSCSYIAVYMFIHSCVRVSLCVCMCVRVCLDVCKIAAFTHCVCVCACFHMPLFAHNFLVYTHIQLHAHMYAYVFIANVHTYLTQAVSSLSFKLFNSSQSFEILSKFCTPFKALNSFLRFESISKH